MTPRPDRPDEWGSIGDHEERIRILESISVESGVRALGCTNCYKVPAAYADCLDIEQNPCSEDAITDTMLQGNVGVATPIPGSDLEIGSYQCNYDAGFRIQVSVALLADGGPGGGCNIYAGIAPDGLPIALTDWDLLVPINGPNVPTNYTSPWVTLSYGGSPTSLYDPWYIGLGYNNVSILFDGHIYGAQVCARYIHTSQLATLMPAAIAPGDIIYSVGTTWSRLPIGAAGQALKVNGAATAPVWV